MKVASKKRNEGRKAETKTSDKENESIQRKWPRGAAPAEESPTAWCFLSSQRQECVWGGSWPTALCHHHLLASGQRQPMALVQRPAPVELRCRAQMPGGRLGRPLPAGAAGTLITPHWASVFFVQSGYNHPEPITLPGGVFLSQSPEHGEWHLGGPACAWGAPGGKEGSAQSCSMPAGQPHCLSP